MTDKKKYDEFLNPKSMLTPGLAGSLTMFITNALATQFALPPNYTGLGISFLFGLLVFGATIAAFWTKLLLYLLNSLLIFSVALGANQVGVGVSSKSERIAELIEESIRTGTIQQAFFSNWLDGTVGSRNSLLTMARELDDSQARKILGGLGHESDEYSSARASLLSLIAHLRTDEQVQSVAAYFPADFSLEPAP